MQTHLSSRNRQSELMDDPSLNEATHHQALAGLRRINCWSRSDRTVWKEIRKQALLNPGEGPLTILDIAAGSGDRAIRLASHAKRCGVSIMIDGCDISPTAVIFATDEAAVANYDNVRFFECDALQQPFPQPKYDVVMCSLFLHHLNNADAILLLQRMRAAATQLVLVDDLRRTRLGYWLAWLGCRILTRCHVVHVDGPMSVEGAFTSNEALGIAAKAGLQFATLEHHWPQRFTMAWRPNDCDVNVE